VHRGIVGVRLDLPGATAAGFICGAAVLAAAALAVTVGKDAEQVRHAAVAAAAGALALAAAVHVWPVRFEYYLYLVADLQRRGEPAQVLAAYEKAEPYAPAGQSRRRQIEALRSRLEAVGASRQAASAPDVDDVSRRAEPSHTARERIHEAENRECLSDRSD
jgi:hypothetical protein